MDELQFYPTPRWLADRAWNMFSDREFTRVLDPSAGEGALAQAAPRDYYDRAPKVDVIEIDASKHPILREHGLRVVGLDFLGFEGGHCYTHVVMNPPFAAGAKHVLKAWDMLWEGEIVAILNAQTLRNPFSAERKRLLQLVEDHGSVEYISDRRRAGLGWSRGARLATAWRRVPGSSGDPAAVASIPIASKSRVLVPWGFGGLFRVR